MNIHWPSWNDITSMLRSIWPFMTSEERNRLEALRRNAENGSMEIQKQLYAEVYRIHEEQRQASAQMSSHQTLQKTPEMKELQSYNSSNTVAIQYPTMPSHNHSGCYPPQSTSKIQKLSKKYEENRAYKNVYDTKRKIMEELASSSRPNLQARHPPSFSSNLTIKYPKHEKMEIDTIEDSIDDTEKFDRELDAMKMENDKRIAQQKAEHEAEIRRREEKFKESLAPHTRPTIPFQSTSSIQTLPSEHEPMPSSNVSNFADDLTAILKKHRRSPSPPPEPSYPRRAKYKTTISKKADPPTQIQSSNVSTEKFVAKNVDKKEIPQLIISKNDKMNIGVMGLTGAGKSYLISALTNIPFKEYGNKKSMKFGRNCVFFEIDHPNYGFVSNQPEAIKRKCQEYFDQIQIYNLTCLLNVVNGDLREEDIFATQLALQAGIKVVIIRSKSDEWLDGSYPRDITPKNKEIFAEKDKRYIRSIAEKIDEAVAACPIFNISALSISKSSTKTKRAAAMEKYLIDELALIEYLENFGINFDSLKNNVLEATSKTQSGNSEKTLLNLSNPAKRIIDQTKNEKVDILFVGRIGGGKSAIIDALRGIRESDENSATKFKTCMIQNLHVTEFSYQEPTSISQIIEQLHEYNLHQLKQVYLVIGDAIGEMDVKFVKFAVDEKLPLSILLTKTDSHIDNATERHGFQQNEKEKYYNHRKNSTQHEIAKLVHAQIDMFIISSHVIRNLVAKKDKFLQYACDDNEFLTNWSKIN